MSPGAYGRYFRVAAFFAFAYAALTFAAAAFSFARVGGDLYDPTYGTAGRLLRVYGDDGLLWAARLSAGAGVLLVAALPAVAFRLAWRTPGLAWGGLAVGALAFLTRWFASLADLAAYGWARPGEAPPLFLAIPQQDVALLANAASSALAAPGLLASFLWMAVWGAAFLKGEGWASRLAGGAFVATVILSLMTWGAAARAHLPILIYVGSWLAAAAEATAWGGVGATLYRADA